MRLQLIKEPNLIFGFDQKTIDPRDGLALFGPYEKLNPYTLRVGLIGSNNCIEDYKSFVQQINKPIVSTQTKYNITKSLERQRPSFPGFEAIFDIKWPNNPETNIEVDQKQIKILLANKNRTIRTSSLVDLFLERIIEFQKKEDNKLDLWFIVVPYSIYESCRPQSWGKDIAASTQKYIAQAKLGQTSLDFPGEEDFYNSISSLTDTAADFHHLLKARLIQEGVKVPVQLIIDRTLKFRDKVYNKKFDEYLKAHFAWTQSTTLYYKLGKLPWKLGDIREGVCYLGLVFKKLNDNKNVCSAAQMFLRDGDGSVFRGNIGLWESSKPYEFHLSSESAEQLIGMALDDYNEKWKKYPLELFIHSKTMFNDEEWEGFSKAVSQRNANTNLVGILIKDMNELKLFRHPSSQIGNYGTLRGTALIVDDSEAYLCTKGFIPRLNTSNSLEMPRNLRVKIIRGDARIETVLEDILALTKLNYNSCIYGDGIPVTLKFSHKIGSILTATPDWKVDTRQFMFYI
ncbi:hypothetical protein COR50_17370 [Chitinophaga caeni]|uniref:Piwi domain-containing protein n=1 Tax=Chitinophaga caeni TaxID=2029983 RepID=A0A291QXX5_9BACT|nr:hypothetical protein [Chitinophaga caeni]ATL48790.1 hypothetical protein COR50_17370 [Chitinophaga caeni]